MKLKISNVLQIIAAVFAVLAIVCLFLPGVTIGNPQIFLEKMQPAQYL